MQIWRELLNLAKALSLRKVLSIVPPSRQFLQCAPARCRLSGQAVSRFACALPRERQVWRERGNLAKALSLRKVLSIVPPSRKFLQYAPERCGFSGQARHRVSLVYCRRSGKCGVPPLERGHERQPCEGFEPSQGSVNRAPKSQIPPMCAGKMQAFGAGGIAFRWCTCRGSGKCGGTLHERGLER